MLSGAAARTKFLSNNGGKKDKQVVQTTIKVGVAENKKYNKDHQKGIQRKVYRNIVSKRKEAFSIKKSVCVILLKWLRYNRKVNAWKTEKIGILED